MIEAESDGCTEVLNPVREPVYDEVTGQLLGYYLDPEPPAPLEPTLATVVPNGWAAFELDATTAVPDTLPDAMLIDAIVGFENQIAWATARQHELLAAFAERPSDGSLRALPPTPTDTAGDSGAAQTVKKREWAADEIALALHLAPMAATIRVAQAQRLAGVLRPTRDLLDTGRLCPSRARLITDMLVTHDDTIAAAVQERVLPRAPEQTTDPDHRADHHSARHQRRTRRARRLRSHPRRAGPRHRPGPTSTWRRLLTDPVTGALLDYGRTTYRPPAPLARHVQARDRTCRYPGCARPAVGCELDHVQPWQGGDTTSEANLCALCDRHHSIKHQPGWQVVLHADRSLEWTTPTGHRYVSPPADLGPPVPGEPSGAASPEQQCGTVAGDRFTGLTVGGTDNVRDDPPPF